MFVCLCEGVNDRQVRSAIAAGAGTVAEVGAACGAGTTCGGCVEVLVRLLAEETGRRSVGRGDPRRP